MTGTLKSKYLFVGFEYLIRNRLDTNPRSQMSELLLEYLDSHREYIDHDLPCRFSSPSLESLDLIRMIEDSEYLSPILEYLQILAHIHHLDTIIAALTDTEHLTTSSHEPTPQIIDRAIYCDEVRPIVSQIRRNPLDIRIALDHSLHTRIGHGLSYLILIVRHEDSLPIASVFTIELEYCVSGRARSCEKVENYRVCVSRMK